MEKMTARMGQMSLNVQNVRSNNASLCFENAILMKSSELSYFSFHCILIRNPFNVCTFYLVKSIMLLDACSFHS